MDLDFRLGFWIRIWILDLDLDLDLESGKAGVADVVDTTGTTTVHRATSNRVAVRSRADNA